jgi:hypothetical protein
LCLEGIELVSLLVKGCKHVTTAWALHEYDICQSVVDETVWLLLLLMLLLEDWCRVRAVVVLVWIPFTLILQRIERTGRVGGISSLAA